MVYAKFQNKVGQQTLDFDEITDIAQAKNEGVTKEKCLPQGTVHKITREEAAKQHKRDFARLKTSIERKLATQLNKNTNKSP